MSVPERCSSAPCARRGEGGERERALLGAQPPKICLRTVFQVGAPMMMQSEPEMSAEAMSSASRPDASAM